MSLKKKLAAGERVNVFALSRLYQPNMIEMFAIQGGFDGFWIDAEHASFSAQDIEVAAAYARASNLDCFVRIPPHDYSLVTRCIESGAEGVMAAQIVSAEQAEEFVQWAKFAPRGKRGLNAGCHDGQFGTIPVAEFCQQANERSFVAIQIETLQALEECDEIAAIDGVDLLFIGPSDLSQALGVTGDFMHESCIAAIKKVAAACAKHGKTFGAVTTTPEHAHMLAELGCKMLSPTNDIRTFNAGIKAVKESFSEFF
ncbi:HpcH/HpaI aldolase family protein [Thalassoglobus polymorphus]|uniref:5-keto-4-deoxy-D-glucarate aldolase n=1 Tax=Thalassoglobus polymorphus TaxID=2527994 RepID=A0A517QML4_9PLAN|nr:aldolase/citrate lyase family protein [Thalassoglobus polymorphus]QDT32876.1 5-keto-4-deoxy-D-glucarate aldolase [Thalassoglobus polymorphus]